MARIKNHEFEAFRKAVEALPEEVTGWYQEDVIEFLEERVDFALPLWGSIKQNAKKFGVELPALNRRPNGLPSTTVQMSALAKNQAYMASLLRDMRAKENALPDPELDRIAGYE